MNLENTIKLFVALVGLAGFLFGVFQFLQVQAVEAEKPYLEKKLKWCEEAVETTSRIATAAEPAPKDINRFWQMYWGVMGMIEKDSVTRAMIEFGKSLESIQPAEAGAKAGGADPSGLAAQSLALAHACRRELSAEWSASWARSR